jgi:hypothetical protein
MYSGESQLTFRWNILAASSELKGSQARNHREEGSLQVSYMLHTCFMLGLHFNHEAGGDMLFRNVS